MNVSEIKDIIDNNRFDYIYRNFNRKKPNKRFDISIIIPVRGRTNFLNTCIHYLKESIKKTNLNVNISVVEHSEIKEHEVICKSLNIDYYWIDSLGEKFNKCLCHNVGSIINRKSDYFLFHDLDCLVYDDFIINIIRNKENKNTECLQTFFNRRVLYLNEEQTDNILNKTLTINEINLNEVTEGNYGAPGGSIFLNKNLFFDVGGYDPELFYGYSPEDIFFWDKIETITKIQSVDNPKNELLHLFHDLQSNEDSIFLENFYHKIKSLGLDGLKDITKYKSVILKKYI